MSGACLVCHRPAAGPGFANTDRFSRETFRLLECPPCGVAWVDVKEDFNPGPYYPPIYYGQKSRRFNPLMEALVTRFRRGRADLMERVASTRPGRVLDVGCGRGLMLRVLRGRGWECFGTEYSEVSSRSARESDGVSIQLVDDVRKCGFPDRHFDLISLWHVLEHLSRPTEALHELRRVLKPDGALVIEVPNFASFQAKMDRSRWIYLEAPRHLFQFSPQALARLLRSSGFEATRWSTFSLEFGIFGMVQSLLNRVMPRPNFLYSVLNEQERKTMSLRSPFVVVNFVLLGLFLIPAGILGVLLELIAVACGCGGVIRVVARPSSPS